jgi:hypothetical protein
VPVREPRVPAEAPLEYEPLPPERGPWRENPWPALVTGLIALVIGGVVGYAIGNKNESERPGATVTRTSTVVQPKTVVQTHTVTASTVRETPAAPASNQPAEERRKEAEANLKSSERENRELRKRLEEVGGSP